VCEELIGYTSQDPYCEKCHAELDSGEVFSTMENQIDYIDTLYVLYTYDNNSAKFSVFHSKNTFSPQFAEFYTRICERLFSTTDFIHKIDYVTYSTRRLSEKIIKGHDQAKEMAKAISHLTGIPYKNALIRTRKSKKQRNLSPEERAENVKDLFRCTIDITGKNILLTDDVMTTGATLSECAKALKIAGAKSVTVLVFAT
jgi:ComF family protein